MKSNALGGAPRSLRVPKLVRAVAFVGLAVLLHPSTSSSKLALVAERRPSLSPQPIEQLKSDGAAEPAKAPPAESPLATAAAVPLSPAMVVPDRPSSAPPIDLLTFTPVSEPPGPVASSESPPPEESAELQAATSGSLKADYRFADTLAPHFGSAPDLTAMGSMVYSLDNDSDIGGDDGKVVSFNSDEGVKLDPTSGVVANNQYSVELIYRPASLGSTPRRILDFKNGTSDNGLYTQNGSLLFRPTATSTTGGLQVDRWTRLLFTRSSTGAVKAYVNGVEKLSFTDTSSHAVLSNVLRFFKDNDSGGATNEEAAGRVARITLYNEVLLPGDPDFTFGCTALPCSGSRVSPVGSGHDIATGVAVQNEDGKIIVAGRSFNGSNYDFAVSRFTAEGALDTTWGTGGTVLTPIGSSDDFATDVAILDNDRVVVAGYTKTGSNYDFALVRRTTAGALDITFDGGSATNSLYPGNGKVVEAIGAGDDLINSLTTDVNGVIAAGVTFNGSNYDFAVTKYVLSGTRDTAFSGDGLVTVAVGTGNDIAQGVARQTDGDVVVAGYSSNLVTGYDFAAVRLNSNGALDVLFAGDGSATMDIGTNTNDYALDVGIQSGNKVVLSGSRSPSGGTLDIAVARFTNLGVPDTSFDADGKITFAPSAADDMALTMTVRSDDTLFIGGSIHNGINLDAALLRLGVNGAPELAFGGGDGMVNLPLGMGNDYINDLTLDKRVTSEVSGTDGFGRVVASLQPVGGSGTFDYGVARYTP